MRPVSLHTVMNLLHATPSQPCTLEPHSRQLSFPMLGEPPLLFEFWCRALLEAGFVGSRSREMQLAKFLVRNEMTKLMHLQFAVHPSRWTGAEAFSAAELESVWSMRMLTCGPRAYPIANEVLELVWDNQRRNRSRSR